MKRPRSLISVLPLVRQAAFRSCWSWALYASFGTTTPVKMIFAPAGTMVRLAVAVTTGFTRG